eukprot:762970-Hanusia_phi.AAC.2
MSEAFPNQQLDSDMMGLAKNLALEASRSDQDGRNFGEVFLPDADSFMRPASQLVYDDAPWLSSTMNDVLFVHHDICNEAAQSLGLKSVRKLLISGQLNLKDLPCPSPSTIGSNLRDFESHGQMLSHLVDFADTLGSREVCFLFDFRTHSSQSLLQPNLSSLQGPSLIMYLKGVKLGAEQISRLQCQNHDLQGLHRTVKNGPGLNTMYHFTDVPCIVSGEGLYFFDPQGSYFVDQDQNKARPVGKAHLYVNSDLSNKFADQFVPFQVFGFNAEREFHGTLFRMPIRLASKDEAREVSLGRNMDVEEFQELLASSSNWLNHESLLFLEHLESIEVCSWSEDSGEMVSEFKTSLDLSISASLRLSRRALSANKEWQKFNLMSVFGSVPAIKHMFEVKINTVNRRTGVKQQHHWLIAGMIGSRTSRKMALEHKTKKLVPCVAVAALLSCDGLALPKLEGQLFAYSKVMRTGLPVHINGWFEVTSNAFGLLQNGLSKDNLSSVERFELEWNQELLESSSEAYVDLLASMCPRFKHTPLLFYSRWPQLACIETPFIETVHRPLYSKLAQLPLFLLGSGNFVKLQSGVFPPEASTSSNSNLQRLCSLMFPLFSCPSFLGSEIRNAGVRDVSEISPEKVRARLKGDPRLVHALIAGIPKQEESPSDSTDQVVDAVIEVLEFCLQDLSSHGKRDFKSLHAVRLLPLANGSIVNFPYESFVASEEEQVRPCYLLPRSNLPRRRSSLVSGTRLCITAVCQG